MPAPTGHNGLGRLEVIEGVLDRIVYASESGDFVVARLVVRGRRDPLTIVGNLPSPRPGETLILEGNWEFDKKFGEQFHFERAETRAPSTVQGIEKYLSSTLVKGIGPEMARRITTMFGEATLDVIENHPNKLLKVPGIGKQRAERISQAFQDQKAIRNVMLFLQTHGITPAYALKIFKKYGTAAIDVVSTNPYVLATDIRGVGFKSADKIAGSLGIDMKSPLRAQAGILHVLDTVQSEGHVYYPLNALVEKARDLLSIDVNTLDRALGQLRQGRLIEIEGDRVYPARMAYLENQVAERLAHLLTSPRFLPSINVDAAMRWVEQRSAIELSTAQKEALRAAIEHKVLIITGGPGTGKTTVLRALNDILEAKKLRVLMAAPTGRAAKRLAEATGRDARTVHRLLEYSPGEGGFLRSPERPLDAEFVIVDEVSMVDITLMYHLLGAVDPRTTLVLVGDADQLPSVGPGNVLGDLISSGVVPVVRLDTVFRQARSSLIITNAHLVNRGTMPIPAADRNEISDFYLIEKDDPEEALRIIKEMVTRRIPDRFGLNPVTEIQVLSPMHKGTLGTENLNRELKQLLNPNGQAVKGGRFAVGDRVMQIRNDYDKEVFNGDVGRVASYNDEWEEVTIDYDGRQVTYHVSELDDVILAYAVTIHKAQGSEYPAVIIPLSTQHYVLLRRNLLYTAMTRGKQLVVLLGSPRALKIAVENTIVEPRFTGLAEKLARGGSAGMDDVMGRSQ
ncbi:MAG: ATP-dependent RecD-like DNA helicase [Desulfomonile sp.]|nr:ATP-dependent RecD-like DNA helicase [Desulfomonile sp.]